MNGEHMAREIGEQPLVMERLLGARTAIAEVARAVRARNPRFVLFVARGSSDHAATYAKYLVETRLGLPAGLFSPSTVTLYDARIDLRDVLVIAVSQSGGSPDLVEPITRARASGAVTVAITNAPASPLARAAELSIDLDAGEEQAVAATKTYVAELLTLFLFVEALADRRGEAADDLPDRARRLLGREQEVELLATRYRFADPIVTTARGYAYTTALEAALKLSETSYVVAHAFSSADLLHGPLAMIDHGFPVIAIAPVGRAREAMRAVLERLDARGADRLVIGDATLGGLSFALDPVPEVVAPLLAILPLQQLAFHLARARGVDPDAPRGLEKVTRTW